MPELPEVETTRRGIEPLITGRIVTRVVVRVAKLRWPISRTLEETLCGQSILGVERRAKYLLLRFGAGTALIHLGMSGHLRVVPEATPAGKHDHVDIALSDGNCLRFNDPRRFGALLWLPNDPQDHPLLAELGPEPFAAEMDGDYLFQRSRGRKVAVKPFIMDQRVLVGVGNIYASEALFRAGIDPRREAGAVSLKRYRLLAEAIRKVLAEAIAAGGTTIRDFRGEGGKPGYFALQLRVYGREGEPCPGCGRPIRVVRLGQRASYFCASCQK
ncbi:formamidopyrimidine-DNA glycosylase [Desulfuromonas versatilis]|uniref:Formamidopyrimidine-DNA glycosylase n=1 Tax=Desulfuromonas versatilis TaxID=2802975 RepID=A0ABN6DZ81_9BACT|nr:bifunctional DNA-formamidopyrimidine glycosylase/DNA-(apurinic or apyrimidinic site) lyase [Desulfuromonas versatilis]BCR05383.1 formamidopyrimidine-DNA glycosylase [Desulfuromonas versatilis]